MPKTKLLEPVDLLRLRRRLHNGDQASIDAVFNEITRLSLVLKSYEIFSETLSEKFNSDHLKIPDKIPVDD